MKTVEQLLEAKRVHRANTQAKRRQKRRERDQKGYKEYYITREPGYRAFMRATEEEKGC